MRTASSILDTLFERTRAALGAAQLEHLLPTLDHIKRTQRTQLLQMVEATLTDLLPPAVPPPGSLKGRTSIEPQRFKGLLPVLNKLMAIHHTRRPPFVCPVAGETVLGDRRDMLRLGAPQIKEAMGLKGLLGPGNRVTLDTLHALEHHGAAMLQYTSEERIDRYLDNALLSSSPEAFILPAGAADFLRSAIYKEDQSRSPLHVAYWQALDPELARRLFPHLPSGYEGLIWGTDGHRVHAVAVPHAPRAPQHPRAPSRHLVPISPLALADSNVLQIYTWDGVGHFGAGASVAAAEAVTVTPNTLSRRVFDKTYSPDLSTVINGVPACEGPAAESPIATCKGFSVKAFKAALNNLKAEAKQRGLKLSDLPFLFRLKDGRARIIAQGPSAPDIKGRVEVVELAERELEGWTVDPSIQTNLNPDYALDAFGALGDFTLVCRSDKTSPPIMTSASVAMMMMGQLNWSDNHIITSAARPYLGVILAPVRS